MVESVDTKDLKSFGLTAVRVQVPLRVQSLTDNGQGFFMESNNVFPCPRPAEGKHITTSQDPDNKNGESSQFGESKHFPAQVFLQDTNVVHVRMIDNKETAVDIHASMYRYEKILAVVPLHIQLKLAETK